MLWRLTIPFGGQGFRIGDYKFAFKGLGFWGFESSMGISRWFQGSGLGVLGFSRFCWGGGRLRT